MTEINTNTHIGKYKIIRVIRQEAERMLYLVEDAAQQQLLLESYTCVRAETAVSQLTPLQNIPASQIVEVSYDDNQLLIAFPYQQGCLLSDLLAENPAALTTGQSLKLAQQLATILDAAAEQAIYHADIHPENIWITESETVVWLGWGIQNINTNRTTPANQLAYTAPEITNKSELTAQAAIYSFGILLFTLLAQHPPQFDTQWDIFSNGDKTRVILLEDTRPGLAAETYLLVRNCLWRQPWGRHASIAALLTGIDDALVAESTPVTPSKRIWAVPPISLPANKKMSAYGGVGILIIVGLLYFAFRGTFAAAPTGSTITAVPALINAEETVTKTAVASTTPTPAATDHPTILTEPETPTTTNVFNTNTPTTTSTQTPTTKPSLTSTPANTSTATPSGTNTPTPTTFPTATEIGTCIPFKPEGWIIYTIQANDYLFDLAIQTGTTVAYVQEVNCLINNTLSIGQTLFLPTQPIANSPTPDATANAGGSDSNQPGNPQPQSTKKPPRPTKTPPP